MVLQNSGRYRADRGQSGGDQENQWVYLMYKSQELSYTRKIQIIHTTGLLLTDELSCYLCSNQGRWIRDVSPQAAGAQPVHRRHGRPLRVRQDEGAGGENRLADQHASCKLTVFLWAFRWQDLKKAVIVILWFICAPRQISWMKTREWSVLWTIISYRRMETDLRWVVTWSQLSRLVIIV